MILSAVLLSIQAASPIYPVTLTTPEGAHEPQVAVEPNHGHQDWRTGRDSSPPVVVHVVFGTRDAIYVSEAGDRGMTFGSPVRVAEVGSLALGMRRGPRIALSGSTIVVTAIAGERGGGREGDLLCWRLSGEGDSWKPTGRINATAGSAREGLHAMAAGADGRIFCAWIDLNGDSPRICGALSKDSGGTWSVPAVIQGDPNSICPCCHPSVAIDGKGAITVMWRGQESGARDMVAARSENDGATFSKPVKLGTGMWKIDACPMDGGAMISTLGRTVTVWRRQEKVFRAEVGGPEVYVGDGEQPWITSGTLGLYVLWLRKRGGPLMLSWTGLESPLEIDSAATDPMIASLPGSMGPTFAAWESGEGDHAKIVVARIGGPTRAK